MWWNSQPCDGGGVCRRAQRAGNRPHEGAQKLGFRIKTHARIHCRILENVHSHLTYSRGWRIQSFSFGMCFDCMKMTDASWLGITCQWDTCQVLFTGFGGWPWTFRNACVYKGFPESQGQYSGTFCWKRKGFPMIPIKYVALFKNPRGDILVHFA
jgi:hypothetical protein